jgi:hypothetical protein
LKDKEILRDEDQLLETLTAGILSYQEAAVNLQDKVEEVHNSLMMNDFTYPSKFENVMSVNGVTSSAIKKKFWNEF